MSSINLINNSILSSPTPDSSFAPGGTNPTNFSICYNSSINNSISCSKSPNNSPPLSPPPACASPTPNKRRHSPSTSSGFRHHHNNTTFNNILQKQASFKLNSSPQAIASPDPKNLANLHHFPSKLDLIDDTTLTSLPLPPPPSKPKSRGSNSGSVSSTSYPNNKSRTNSTTSVPPQLSSNLNSNRHFLKRSEGSSISVNSVDSHYTTFQNQPAVSSVHSSSSQEDIHTILDQPIDEDTFEDSEDPIVLIEDYMSKNLPRVSDVASTSASTSPPRSTSPNTDFHPSHTSPGESNIEKRSYMIDRKKSLANFKQRVFNKNFSFGTFSADTNSISSQQSLQFQRPSNKRSISMMTDNTNSSANLNHVAPPGLGLLNMSTHSFFQQKSENLENWEAIFGKIPGTDQLKYCELCEKPLYEISSVINNYNASDQDDESDEASDVLLDMPKALNSRTASNATTTSTLQDPEDKTITTNNNNHTKLDKVTTATSVGTHTDDSKVDINQLYTEFICWECIEIYEDFFNELYQIEMSQDCQELEQDSMNNGEQVESTAESQAVTATGSRGSKGKNLVEIFQQIQHKYDSSHNFQPPPKKISKKSSFSDDLMNKLHQLNNSAVELATSRSLDQHQQQNGSDHHTKRVQKVIDADWVKTLQYKFRWRWRFNGLIPTSLTSQGSKKPAT